MSFAFFALYTGDYLRDTRHLTPLKHGIYLLFLMHCWDQKGPLPTDEIECSGIANCRSADEIEAMRYVLERFFVRMDDGWYNSRMQKEISRAEALSGVRRIAGAKGGVARAKHLPSKSQARATTPTPTPKNNSYAPDGAFLNFWKLYPRKISKGKAFKAWNSTASTPQIIAEIMAGLERNLPQILKMERKYVLYPASWLNARGWEDEGDDKREYVPKFASAT